MAYYRMKQGVCYNSFLNATIAILAAMIAELLKIRQRLIFVPIKDNFIREKNCLKIK